MTRAMVVSLTYTVNRPIKEFLAILIAPDTKWLPDARIWSDGGTRLDKADKPMPVLVDQSQEAVHD